MLLILEEVGAPATTADEGDVSTANAMEEEQMLEMDDKAISLVSIQ